MRKISHIASASDDPGPAAESHTENFGWKELSRHCLDPDNGKEAPRGCGVFMADGAIDNVILKFRWDQLGKGLDYTGLHHFGIVVVDTNERVKKAKDAGLECADPDGVMPLGRHAEIKFRGPDGVVFDITGSPRPGSA